jgi:hypothetical protein
MTREKLRAVRLPLASSRLGVVGVPVHLLRESRHMRLIYVADRWAWSPPSARAALVTGGGGLFMTLGTPRTIPNMTHKWPLLHLSIV